MRPENEIRLKLFLNREGGYVLYPPFYFNHLIGNNLFFSCLSLPNMPFPGAKLSSQKTPRNVCPSSGPKIPANEENGDFASPFSSLPPFPGAKLSSQKTPRNVCPSSGPKIPADEENGDFASYFVPLFNNSANFFCNSSPLMFLATIFPVGSIR